MSEEQSTHQKLPDNKSMQGESNDIIPSQASRDFIPIFKKVQVFLVSFLAYTSVHALRTTYSFSKSYLQEQIDMQEKFIGIVDSVMLLFIGFGNFMIAIYPLQKPIRALWIALLLCGVQYCFIPLSMNLMSGVPAFQVLVILMGLSGYLQSFTWPNLLPLVHTVCSPDKDTTLLGFWATCPNFGNIIGFVVCQLIVLNNGYSWEVGMYIIALYMISISIYIAFRIQQMPGSNNGTSPQIKQENSQKQPLLKSELPQLQIKQSSQSTSTGQSSEQYPSIINVFKSSPRITLLAISFSLLKSVMYGILLWLPAYFYSIGLVDYQLYIPMAFDGSSILGSTLLGAIFKQLPPHKKNFVLIPVLFFLMVFFIMLKAIDFTVAGYFSIISLVGLCLGGSYNTMAGLVTMQLVRTTPPSLKTKYLRFYSALLMAFANILTAITQVIISYTVGQDDGALFGIFVIYTGINICSMIGVVIIQTLTANIQKNKLNEEQSKANDGSKEYPEKKQINQKEGPKFQQIQFEKLN